MNALISRTTMNTCYPHQSPNSTASLLMLLEIGSGDSGVLTLSAGFQNSPWNKKSNLSAGIADLRCLKRLAYSSDKTMSVFTLWRTNQSPSSNCPAISCNFLSQIRDLHHLEILVSKRVSRIKMSGYKAKGAFNCRGFIFPNVSYKFYCVTYSEPS